MWPCNFLSLKTEHSHHPHSQGPQHPKLMTESPGTGRGLLLGLQEPRCSPLGHGLARIPRCGNHISGGHRSLAARCTGRRLSCGMWLG